MDGATAIVEGQNQPLEACQLPSKGVSVASERNPRKAEAKGVSREDMTLHLNHSDVSALSKDRTLAVDDISFTDGVMRFMGVKIERGGVQQSVLRGPGEA